MILAGMVLALIVVAGLNGPLAVCAVSFAVFNQMIEVRPEFAWLGEPWLLTLALTLLLVQCCADLYFVPITVKDWRYLNPNRIHNAYLHARMQSLFRPLCGALVGAAMLVPMEDWAMAVLGFCGAAAIYWLSAWIREFVARTRGAIVLIALETAKNILLFPVVMLVFWMPLLAIVVLSIMLTPTALWTLRLQREYWLYAPYGGQRAGEDA